MFCSRSPAVNNICIRYIGLWDCGSTSSIPTPSNLSSSKCFLSHFFFKILLLTSWLRDYGSRRLMSRNHGQVFWSRSPKSRLLRTKCVTCVTDKNCHATVFGPRLWSHNWTLCLLSSKEFELRTQFVLHCLCIYLLGSLEGQPGVKKSLTKRLRCDTVIIKQDAYDTRTIGLEKVLINRIKK